MATEVNPIPVPDGWIQTYTGRKFHPFEPRLEDIDIEDIAHSLSLQCRFSGHCKEFYSVAQHCVIAASNASPENALWVLLHDAPEAYLTDIPRPLKRLPEFRFYKIFENQLMQQICQKYGLPLEEPAEVKEIDLKMLVTEARDVMSNLHPEWHYKEPEYEAYPDPIDCMTPQEAKHAYLQMFHLVSGYATKVIG